MPRVIIVGFEYQNQLSTLNDIYVVYSFYRDRNYEISIASDIEEYSEPANLSSILTSGYVDSLYIPFIEKKFKKIRTLIQNKTQLKNFLKENLIVSHDKKLIIYYTGHGGHGYLKLPDGSKLRIQYLRNLIIQSSFKQILVIMDCCYPSNMMLPYEYDDQDHSVQLKRSNFVAQQIIVLCPCDDKQRVPMPGPFSHFTIGLIQIFNSRKHNCNLSKIKRRLSNDVQIHCKSKNVSASEEEIQQIQIPQIYVSHPYLTNLWSWIWSNGYDIVLHEYLDIIDFRRYKYI